jgi:DNA-directed RNA polymerase subunit beta
MTADEEDDKRVAPGDIPVDDNDSNHRSTGAGALSPRFHYNNAGSSGLCCSVASANRSVATSLIPFLEHDDANRALMGRTCNGKLYLC